jgi:hypothetical protein
VATLVTLVLVPVLYVVFVEDLHLVRWEVELAPHAASAPASMLPTESQPSREPSHVGH